MIETYKIVSEKYQPDVAPTLYKSSVRVTRGNDMRLEKSRVKYDLRKFSFSNRVDECAFLITMIVILTVLFR